MKPGDPVKEKKKSSSPKEEDIWVEKKKIHSFSCIS